MPLTVTIVVKNANDLKGGVGQRPYVEVGIAGEIFRTERASNADGINPEWDALPVTVDVANMADTQVRVKVLAPRAMRIGRDKVLGEACFTLSHCVAALNGQWHGQLEVPLKRKGKTRGSVVISLAVAGTDGGAQPPADSANEAPAAHAPAVPPAGAPVPLTMVMAPANPSASPGPSSPSSPDLSSLASSLSDTWDTMSVELAGGVAHGIGDSSFAFPSRPVSESLPPLSPTSSLANSPTSPTRSSASLSRSLTLTRLDAEAAAPPTLAPEGYYPAPPQDIYPIPPAIEDGGVWRQPPDTTSTACDTPAPIADVSVPKPPSPPAIVVLVHQLVINKSPAGIPADSPASAAGDASSPAAKAVKPALPADGAASTSAAAIGSSVPVLPTRSHAPLIRPQRAAHILVAVADLGGRIVKIMDVSTKRCLSMEANTWGCILLAMLEGCEERFKFRVLTTDHTGAQLPPGMFALQPVAIKQRPRLDGKCGCERIQSTAEGPFLSAVDPVSAGPVKHKLLAEAPHIKDWEVFQAEPAADNTFMLRRKRDGRYLCVKECHVDATGSPQHAARFRFEVA